MASHEHKGFRTLLLLHIVLWALLQEACVHGLGSPPSQDVLAFLLLQTWFLPYVLCIHTGYRDVCCL